ncbi:MAG TPA: glycoside hydrolase family 2 protein, partial [Deinococcales bacterium]|nr:glycoside hydrolase family 2 protein [Deinococcales bacterium]
GGTELDAATRRVGVRTLALDQSPDPDEPATRFFRFVLNNVPIFARGADWIPADSFVGTLTRERYTPLLQAARDANLNMLRVWGGGIYEHDAFYDLCDELGLLVWQDFMFACAPYPETPEMQAEVRAEAETQVRRLRAHPSLALWCGNNENQWLADMRNATPQPTVLPGDLYYDRLLPEVVANLDGATPYWPGSPYGGNDHNSMSEGDRHNWDVWHGNRPFQRHFGEPMGRDGTPDGVDPRHYREDFGRFISEFGLHAAPALETLRRVIPPDQWTYHSESFDHHNKDNPKNKGDNLMTLFTGLPETLEDYLDFSQVSQAEGLKIAFEHYRQRKPHCSGALVWQLNDCWPVMSWAILDHNGFQKAAYHYVRRANAPVAASFKPVEGGLEVWIVNDTLQDASGRLDLQLGEFDGPVAKRETLDYRAPANAATRVATLPEGDWPGSAGRYLSLRGAGLPANRHFWAPLKDQQRTPGQVQASIEPVDAHTLRVTLTAERYAYFTHLLVNDETARYSDNHLDLNPGETRVVTVTSPRGLKPEDVTVRNL